MAMREQGSELRPPTRRSHIARQFRVCSRDDAVFRAIDGAGGMQARELGLHAASLGLMQAQHLRWRGDRNGSTGLCEAASDVHYLYLLQGHMQLRVDGEEAIHLGPGDGVNLPGSVRYRGFDLSPDLEWLDIRAPSDAQAYAGGGPTPTSLYAVSREAANAYKVGDGPRRFLAYRDVAATAATGQRVNINIVRNSKAGDSSTGWHYHSLACQFVYVLRGSTRVEVEGEPRAIVLRAGDAMTLPRGLKHDVTGFSEDFTVFEFNIPADYTTAACERPG